MKLKELYTKAKAWCIKTINKARSLKQKLSHDNLFDISIGAVLSLIGLYWYLNDTDMDKAIIIVLPFLISWINELINTLQGAKFGWKDLGFRTIIGILLYLII
jgi:hypothetical protein